MQNGNLKKAVLRDTTSIDGRNSGCSKYDIFLLEFAAMYLKKVNFRFRPCPSRTRSMGKRYDLERVPELLILKIGLEFLFACHYQ
ncbi:hypothetical protein HMPREF1640_10540 [Prevotella sp. S7-1-8]|uniref:hypothetical protein n=1 Tax=Prevotella sp. S7-1-8 TaxID=1284775 RepID=UPI0005100BDB|nr:hypothetical protein [Prevotella sp. S7-1-8]KGF16144.1 hypothetical protein HMPREF1640_10540 [Prevotella sp. S7-1-8]